jgi:hypothetical protein
LISVIIPLLSEGSEHLPLVETLSRSPQVREILLVEANDDLGENALPSGESAKVRVLRAPRGRALQMNAGAAEASSPIFLFLHADSRLRIEALDEVVESLSRPGPAAVAFRLTYREPSRFLRTLAWCGNTIGSFHPFALGDQGLAIRRQAFIDHGGFPELPILEDWYMVRSLRKNGGFRLLGSVCATSGRRFLQNGPLRQLLRNASILLRAGAGEDLESLADAYRWKRRR